MIDELLERKPCENMENCRGPSSVAKLDAKDLPYPSALREILCILIVVSCHIMT